MCRTLETSGRRLCVALWRLAGGDYVSHSGDERAGDWRQESRTLDTGERRSLGGSITADCDALPVPTARSTQ
jgi:hypothetical protein